MNDLITSQKYLDGELDIAERKEFDLKLENDPDLRDDIFMLSELNQYLQDKELNEFELKVNHLIQKNKPGIFYRFQINKFQIAASIAIMLGFFLYLYISVSKPGADKIYTQYYSKYDPDIIKRSDTSSENIYMLAMKDYVNNNYNNAILNFEEMKNNEEYKIIASFYTGLCYMELKDFEKALSNFKLINDSDNVIKVHSQWYSALALLKTNQIEQSKQLLIKIVIEKSFYHENAENLLRTLE